MNGNPSLSHARQGAVTWSFGYWYRAWSAMFLAAAIGSLLILVIGAAALADGEDPIPTALATAFASGLFGAIAWVLRSQLRRNRVTIDEAERVVWIVRGGHEQRADFDDIQTVLTTAGAGYPFPSSVRYRLQNGTLVDGPMQHQGLFLPPRSSKRFADLLAENGINHVLLERP